MQSKIEIAEIEIAEYYRISLLSLPKSAIAFLN
jgi:hypothetical protein